MTTAKLRARSISSKPRCDKRNVKAGFTLIEIMIVVVIVGLLASIAIPSFLKFRRNAQAGTAANDMRVFAEAFDYCAMSEGYWPEDVNAGVVPSEMVGYIKSHAWTSATSIGGRWDWDQDVMGVTAAVSINGHNGGYNAARRIDSILDDGNISSGRVQAPSENYILFILEE